MDDSWGNDDKVSEARKMLFAGIIGLAIFYQLGQLPDLF